MSTQISEYRKRARTFDFRGKHVENGGKAGYRLFGSDIYAINISLLKMQICQYCNKNYDAPEFAHFGIHQQALGLQELEQLIDRKFD